MDAKYPGKSTTFHYNPEVRIRGLLEFRDLRFQSCIDDSLVKEFGFSEHDCGWEMYVEFSKNAQDVIEYFKKLGVPLMLDRGYRYKSVDVEHIKIIFNIICENNTVFLSHLIKNHIANATFCSE